MRSFLDPSAQADVTSGQDSDQANPSRRMQGVSSAHFLKLIEERGATGFWTCDLMTGECTCSPGVSRIIGAETPQPFRMVDILERVHPEDRVLCEDLWPLTRSGVPVNRNFRIIRGDRTVRWIEFHSEVVLDAEQRPARAVGLLHDVTLQHEYRQTLDETLGRYRALVSSVATMEWRATASGEPIFSHGWTALTGQLESDVLRGSWVEAIHPEDRPAMVAAWEHAVATLTPYVINHRILQVNGEYDWFHSRAVPVLHKGGRSHEWLGMIVRHRDFGSPATHGGSNAGTLTAMQIRAARAMLQWTLEDLSRVSGVSVSSIRRIEAEGERATRANSLTAIRDAFEREGLAFSDGTAVSQRRRPPTRD